MRTLLIIKLASELVMLLVFLRMAYLMRKGGKR